MNTHKKISFPLLALTFAQNNDSSTNIRNPYRDPTLARNEKHKSENTPAIVGFLLVMTIMAGVMVNSVFWVFSFFLLIILFGISTKKHYEPSPDKYYYVDINQNISFEEDRISVQGYESSTKIDFSHSEVKDISLYYWGIMPPNAKKASHIHLIKKGKKYDYYIWIDSDESKENLIAILKYLYEKKMPLNEYTNGLRSYLLLNGDVSDLTGLDTVQSLIDEIGEKEDKSDKQLL